MYNTLIMYYSHFELENSWTIDGAVFFFDRIFIV